jgi:hypothetical protein
MEDPFFGLGAAVLKQKNAPVRDWGERGASATGGEKYEERSTKQGQAKSVFVLRASLFVLLFSGR